MKKLLMMILCAGLCVQMTACGLDSNGSKKNKYVEEGAAMLDQDIRSGEFVLDGEVYSFPMPLSDWLDRGWHVSNNYDNKDDFQLEPGGMSTEFELYNENKDYVRVSVLNDTEDYATVDGCLVSSLYISTGEEFELVLPGGIYCESKPADVLAAYGDQDVDDSESGAIKAYYDYTTADDWVCQVELHLVDNDYTINALSSIEYMISSSAEWEEFIQNASGVEGCTKYIDTAMRASFYGDFTEYVENKFDTQENAESLYDSEISYYASGLMYYADVNEEMIEEAAIEEFREIAKKVLAKTKWEVTDVSLYGDQFTGTVEIALYPTDFLTLIDEGIETAISEFQTKYAEVNYDAISDSQLAEIEQDYAEMVLNAIRDKVEETQVTDPIVKSYDIDYDDGIISADDWAEIDDIIMGVAE